MAMRQYASQLGAVGPATIKTRSRGLAAGIREMKHRPTIATVTFTGRAAPRGIEVGCER